MNKKLEGTAGVPEVERSASQIIFGHLPGQTVDINRGIWKVREWRKPRLEQGVDIEALKNAVLAQAEPWSNRDGGFSERLALGKRRLEVRSLARDVGVLVEPFPKIWLCPNCKRVHRRAVGTCECGQGGTRNQVHFVCYCSDCGTIDEPPISRCPTHQQTRIRFPGTMAADQIVQDCPVCNAKLRTGFIGKKCSMCDKPMSAQVHRSSSVYTPRSVVVVNPPNVQQRERIENAGGAAKALGWVLSGLQARWMDEQSAGAEHLRASLKAQGLSDQLVEKMIAHAISSGELSSDVGLTVPVAILERAQREAHHIAVALAESRMTFSDLKAKASQGMFDVFDSDYPKWLKRAGLEAVEFVDRFPVLTGHFGFTRGPASKPQDSVLVPFENRDGDYVVYGEIAETEALFVRLDPRTVAKWLHANGLLSEATDDANKARLAILEAFAGPAGLAVDGQVTTLVHSFAHRFIRIAAVHSGVERSSLSEFLVPSHLGFFVYAAARGDFVLGGLQAVFEGELHYLLREFVTGEHRCALDPGCSQSGGACMACLHLGEPSCRLFNRSLDRSVLFGGHGYLMF